MELRKLKMKKIGYTYYALYGDFWIAVTREPFDWSVRVSSFVTRGAVEEDVTHLVRYMPTKKCAITVGLNYIDSLKEGITK